MQFVVIDLDGTDDNAPARRQAVRQDIKIHKSNTRDPWQCSHDEKWFQD